MISGTQVLARLSDNVRQDDLNRRDTLAYQLKLVSKNLDDIERKISRGRVDLLPLRDKVEANRLSLVALMQEGRAYMPVTRSVSRVLKSDLERKQGKVYPKTELYGGVTMGTGVDVSHHPVSGKF